MAFPKFIEYQGVRIQVDSWAEVREAIQELGRDLVVSAGPEDDSDEARPSRVENHSAGGGLHHFDRTLLAQFIDAGDRGILTQELGKALGKRGKGIRPELDRWSRRISLVTQDQASAFEAIKRFDGRGFKMVEHYRRTAASIIGRPLP
jgi:hypothetical protein